MSTTAGSTLAIRDDQSFWTTRQRSALGQLGLGAASNADLAVFFHQCQRSGLDPFARQIHMVSRQGKQTIQTGIDGFRLVARRATDARGGTLGFEDTLWCGPDGQWTDVWLSSEHPAAARVTVLRDGQRYPGIALWDEYKGVKRDGSLNQMWSTKGALMLAKCAEALALRRAFPQDLSGLYTADEMDQAGNAGSPPPPQARQQGEQGASSSTRDAVASAIGAPVTKETPAEDAEKLLAEVDLAAQDRDALGALWRRAAQLPADDVAPVRSVIESMAAALTATAADGSSDDDAVVEATVVGESA